MNKILSISIAAYNVESYLENTLNSFVCKKEYMDLLEVIVVNDGSLDGTLRIAQRYADLYPNTFIVIDKKNGGYGSTINASMEAASGKYFKLVDGDDWVNTKELERFIEFLSITDVDMAVTRYCLVSDFDNSITKVDEGLEYNGKIQNFDDTCIADALPMHCLTFKTKMLRRSNISITENCFYTDVEFILKPIPFVNTMCCFDACVYMYRIGREGQSVSIKSWQKNLSQALRVTYVLIDFWNKIETNESISRKKKDYIFKRITGTVIMKYKIYISFPASKKYFAALKEYDREVLRLNQNIYKASYCNKIVSLLRTSKFLLYKPLVFAYRVHLRRTNQI